MSAICERSIRAIFFIGSRRERMALVHHCSMNFAAQVGETYSQNSRQMKRSSAERCGSNQRKNWECVYRSVEIGRRDQPVRDADASHHSDGGRRCHPAAWSA
jgi:hypothetical protein